MWSILMDHMTEIYPKRFTKEYDNSFVGEDEYFEFRHIKLTLLDW